MALRDSKAQPSELSRARKEIREAGTKLETQVRVDRGASDSSQRLKAAGGEYKETAALAWLHGIKSRQSTAKADLVLARKESGAAMLARESEAQALVRIDPLGRFERLPSGRRS